MVYECPQCKTPLPPGVMACSKCGLQFATAIPADATVPAPGTVQASRTVFTDHSAPAGDEASSRRVVAVVAALGVVLVAAVLFAIYTFSHTPTSDGSTSSAAASTLPPPPPSALPPNAARPAAAPAGSLAPVQLSGGTGSSTGGATPAGDAALQGRWQAKNLDFYVFNADGSGSRGNTAKPAKTDTFSWVVTNNQLVLNGSKEERLTFSTGPDASVLYLRLPDGRYAQYAKIGAS